MQNEISYAIVCLVRPPPDILFAQDIQTFPNLWQIVVRELLSSESDKGFPKMPLISCHYPSFLQLILGGKGLAFVVAGTSSETDLSIPRKRNPEEIDPTKLSEPVFTDEDWKDFHRGIEFFNSGKFWHAHEAWEQIWRRHEEDSRLFIQGLIQMAAGYHLMIEKKRLSGALSNFEKALLRLRLFEPMFLDLPVSEFTAAIDHAKKEIRQLEKGARKEFDLGAVPVIRPARRNEKP